jgi:hypothetical protein
MEGCLSEVSSLSPIEFISLSLACAHFFGVSIVFTHKTAAREERQREKEEKSARERDFLYLFLSSLSLL